MRREKRGRDRTYLDSDVLQRIRGVDRERDEDDVRFRVGHWAETLLWFLFCLFFVFLCFYWWFWCLWV